MAKFAVMEPTQSQPFFTPAERTEMISLIRGLVRKASAVGQPDDFKALRSAISEVALAADVQRDIFGLNPVNHSLRTASLLCDGISPDRNMIVAILLDPFVRSGALDITNVESRWGTDVGVLLRGLLKVSDLYSRRTSVESENFRKLLLTFAEDIRVIIIMIVERTVLMRSINHHPDEDNVREVEY